MSRKESGFEFSHTKASDFHNRHDGGGRYPTAGSAEHGGSSLPTPEDAGTPDSFISSENGNTLTVFAIGFTPDKKGSLVEEQACEEVTSPGPCSGTVENEVHCKTVYEETFNLFQLALPMYWRVIRGREGFHLVCISKGNRKIQIQREVFTSFDGEVEVFVHNKAMSEEFHKEVLKALPDPVRLNAASLKSFVDRSVTLVLLVRGYEICAGSDQAELESLWSSDNSGFVDNNAYEESRYVRTFRSHGCSLLIPVRNWHCDECKKATRRLKLRLKNNLEDQLSFKGRNSYLGEKQLRAKLEEQRRELKNARRKIDYLESRIAYLVKTEGVHLDKNTSDILHEMVKQSKLTPVQHLFIQQQYKMSMSNVEGATGMWWHPTMIRFVLKLILMKTNSATASSGIIRLTPGRTLFDFEYAISKSEGVFTEKLNKIGEKVKQYDKEHQHYHILLMEEVHICRKLVFRKCDGCLVGYVKLVEVETEMENLMVGVKERRTLENKPAVATKVLTYMVKGCTNFVKEVVAAFPADNLTKEQLFDTTWEVIGSCEQEGVKILALVRDGSSLYRSFIKMHTPATPCASNVVFDTANLFALDRVLYFISDPPHLIKTIRNCFAKSGTESKCTRSLRKNGELIQWKTVERLYKEDMHPELKSCCKLNAENVYLNSYSCMKVSLAVQVLSKTVGMDLKDRNWPDTTATVEFILKVNDFFDNLNGVRTTETQRTANPRLEPYVNVNDRRFDELKDFEQYVLNWEQEVQNLEGFSDEQRAKMTLSPQTIEGIYITVNGFCGAVKYLLGIGASFVNGRTFCQDSLDQYFVKQSASGGDHVNPSVSKISVNRAVNFRKRTGNIEIFSTAIQTDDELLLRRPKRRKSF